MRRLVSDSALGVLEQFGGNSPDPLSSIELNGYGSLLTRMCERGWLVEAGRVSPEGGGMPSRLFRITPLGQLAMVYGRAEREHHG